MNLDVYETVVMECAAELGKLQSASAQDYLLHVMAGTNTYQAQRQSEVTYALALRQAEANYEIALERLRHAP